MITAFLKYLLEENVVDAVVIAAGSEENPWRAFPTIVSKNNMELLYKAQKTRYFPSAMLTSLKKINENDEINKIALVVLPCQMHALANMSTKRFKKYTEKILVTIGTFCLGTYWDGEFFKWLKKK